MSLPSIPTLNSPHNDVGRKPRTIILLFDSPGKFSFCNSNVHKLKTLLERNYEDQVCYYHPGAGARSYKPSHLCIFTRWAWPLLDQAFGYYLSEQVEDGYKFLMETYESGDKICLFGFSRGAHVARALAGMLHKIGLLPKDSMEMVSSAYQHFKSTGPENKFLAEVFKEVYCCDVPVDFIGVWDTPTTVGLVVPLSLPPACVEVNTTTRVFRQALSLDEHRTKFCPDVCRYNHPRQPSDIIRHEMDGMFKTDIKEVWFPGGHTDVGGGSTLNTAEHALSNISLRWMIEEIILTKCNIRFNFNAFDQRYIPHTIGQYKYICEGQRAPTGEEGPGGDLDKQDALLEITDELWKAPSWWVFEIYPLSYIYKDKKGKWVTSWWPHLGRGRLVPPRPLFHTSVKFRMDKLDYKPKALYEKGTETYGS